MTYEITRRFRFEAAHFLPNYDGACARMHGHSYKLEVTLAAQELKNDMLYDFKELKNVVHRVVIDKWDHQTMNDFFEAPTAERMAEAIYCMLQTYFQGTDLFVTKVRLWETEDCCATVGI